ncbi:unnamed protein product [Vitrella brassicaformis CCMP3155]|uniref:Uncharacterized protein n=3 Tax=Vitrella brassicaformis TaxID=1169539 RepID=A0A0G4EYL8_VITBC|nr:unnamed protein product [Vitrella brassicaformis CCMP3155]|eukprot:CEM04153.1 unnamed protein product [Vitrella brassicaformis CCMP3155]
MADLNEVSEGSNAEWDNSALPTLGVRTHRVSGSSVKVTLETCPLGARFLVAVADAVDAAGCEITHIKYDAKVEPPRRYPWTAKLCVTVEETQPLTYSSCSKDREAVREAVLRDRLGRVWQKSADQPTVHPDEPFSNWRRKKRSMIDAPSVVPHRPFTMEVRALPAHLMAHVAAQVMHVGLLPTAVDLSCAAKGNNGEGMGGLWGSMTLRKGVLVKIVQREARESDDSVADRLNKSIERVLVSPIEIFSRDSRPPAASVSITPQRSAVGGFTRSAGSLVRSVVRGLCRPRPADAGTVPPATSRVEVVEVARKHSLDLLRRMRSFSTPSVRPHRERSPRSPSKGGNTLEAAIDARESRSTSASSQPAELPIELLLREEHHGHEEGDTSPRGAKRTPLDETGQEGAVQTVGVIPLKPMCRGA